MKWPVKGLETRLKSSFRRLFKLRRSRFRRHNSDMKFPRTFSKKSPCPQCNSYESDSRWGDNQTTTQTSQQEEARDKKSLYDSGCLYGFINTDTRELNSVQTFQSAQTFSSRGPVKADASVNTDVNSSVQDACNQVEFGENKTLTHLLQVKPVECAAQVKPHMVNVATEPVVFELVQNTKDLVPLAVQPKYLSRQEGLSDRNNLSSSVGHYRSDPLLADQVKREPYIGSQPDQEVSFFYAGDSYKSYSKQINTSVDCLNQVTQSCQSQWLCERSQLYETRSNRTNSEHTRSAFESSHTSIPRLNWYTVGHHAMQPNINVPDPEPCVLTYDYQEVTSDARISTLWHESTPSQKAHRKMTKECGDECLLPATTMTETTTGPSSTATATTTTTTMSALSETRRRRKLHQSMTHLNYTKLFGVVIDKEETPHMVNHGRISADFRSRGQCGSEIDRSRKSSQRQTVSSRSYDRDTYELSTNLIHDKHANVQQTQLGGSAPRRPGLKRTKSSNSREQRSWNKQNYTGLKSLKQSSCKSDDTHHNGYSNPKEILPKSDKVAALQRRGSLLACSTSDDGDQSKILRPKRSADMSSLSSSRTKQTMTAPTTRLSGKPANSKSPTDQTKSAKQGGALPASKDLHQCPTGRHPEVKPEKPCICIMVKRMVLAQSKPVLYSWHYKQTKSTNQARPTANSEVSESRVATPVASGPRNLVPMLPNFQLARPTRMVRGGQGTVAWVSNVATGQFYALKFKQREGRSNSTWEIERREAKLLRYARHEFIVRLFHIYETEETLFMALEWLDGGCLWNHIARLGTMPECYAVYYASCILAALRYLHARCIVYRDMKAENVVLDQRGRPKLIDFGMAKLFARPEPESTVDESFLDSADFDQPPTRYYFAAYLAPEIYDQSQATNALIDSWGLGYILVEMILGYGIFLPMPWEKDPGQHLSEHWKLTLPTDASKKISPTCEDFLYKMLLRQPENRLTLEQAGKHGLFARVPWSNLMQIRGPDLSKCPQKGSNTAQTGTGSSSGGRHWVSKYDIFANVPDVAFAREFLGSAANQNVICVSQPLGINGRRLKIQHSSGNRVAGPTTNDMRTFVQESVKSRTSNASTRSRSVNVGGAIEIRTVAAPGVDTKKEGNKMARTTRRPGVSAT